MRKEIGRKNDKEQISNKDPDCFFAASLSLSAPNGAMGIPVFAEESGDGSDVTMTGATDPSDVPDDTVEETETNQPDAPAESEGTSTGDDPAAGSQPEENNGSGDMPATDNGSAADSRLDENKGSEDTPTEATNGEETPAETKSAKETATDTNDVEEADLNSNLLTLNVERAPAASGSNTGDVDVVVLGDIAVRQSGEADTAFDTENSAVYEVKAGEKIDLALTLNTTQIKQQMNDYYDLAIRQLSTAGTALLHETSSQFVATVTFPETMDISGVDLNKIKDDNLTYYDPGDGSYKKDYKDTSHAFIDSNYQLDQCGKFNISDVTMDPSSRTMTITIDLDATKLNYPSSQDPYAYGHLVCLYEAVENTPDYLSVIIPGIKLNDDYAGDPTTIRGTIGGSFNTWVGAGRFSYIWRGTHVVHNWNGIQDTSINGGTDAAGSKYAITLTVKSDTSVPTPKSKTSSNLDSNYESEVTLSMPSAEEQSGPDIVFVLDKSSCSEETAQEAEALLNNLKNSGAKAAVVAFDGTSHILQGLTKINGADNEIAAIRRYIAANSIPSNEEVNGKNMHAGLLTAENILSADSEVPSSRKYVVMVSDGLTGLFTGQDGNAKDIYWQADAGTDAYSGNIDAWSQVRSKSGNYDLPYGEWNAYLAHVKQWVADDGDTYAKDYLTYGDEITGGITDNSFNYVPSDELDKHALSVDRAVYEAYYEYEKLEGSGIHCYAINKGTSEFGNAFMAALNLISGSKDADFTMVNNEMFKLLGAGCWVEDYMGYEKDDYNFDLIRPEAMTLVIDNTNTGSSETYPAEAIATNHYGFAKQNDGTYKYVVTYYPEDKNANEHFTWKMNAPVTNFEHVSLKYKVKLMNPKEAPGTYGEYDRDGSQRKNSLYTNSKAILHITDSEGKDRGTEEFAKPTVSYTVNKPVTPGPQKTSVSFKKTIPSAKYVPSKFVPRTATAHAEKNSMVY